MAHREVANVNRSPWATRRAGATGGRPSASGIDPLSAEAIGAPSAASFPGPLAAAAGAFRAEGVSTAPAAEVASRTGAALEADLAALAVLAPDAPAGAVGNTAAFWLGVVALAEPAWDSWSVGDLV